MQCWRFIPILLVCGAALSSGCRPSLEERKYRAVKGVARHIDLETGRVSMDWKHEKSGVVRTLTGRVTQTTEIFINGISASLEDIRIGDHGTVIVYPVPNQRDEWIVTSVAVLRDESAMLAPAPAGGQPVPPNPSVQQ